MYRYTNTMKKTILLFFVLHLLCNNCLAQKDSIKSENSSSSFIKYSGYIETYYTYDFSNPSDHTLPNFLYSYNRHHELNLNLGFLKASYHNKNTRANLALMAGTYSNANLVNEPGVLKNIFEANGGVKISKKKNLWIDAGIFPSHMGFESAIGKDCWTLSRSLMAENSPYYEAGAKIGYQSDNQKWFISLLYLNGWQKIHRPNNYNTSAFGHQLIYTPNNKIRLNSSSFIGSDTPDSTNRMRYFHNLYAILQVHPRLGITAGFDIGAQQMAKYSTGYYVWYSQALIIKLKITDKLYITARGEYYHDENGVIIATGTANGFQTFGYSLNLDYTLLENIVWRIEGRAFNSKDKIFLLNDKASTNNYFVTTALAISF